MKKHFQPLLSGFLALLFAVTLNGFTCAQSMLDRTHIPTFRNEIVPFSTRFSNGCTFDGVRRGFYSDSKPISLFYTGTLTYPDGTKVISVKDAGSFDQNFAANGKFGVEQNGQMQFYTFKNGYMQEPFTPTQGYLIMKEGIVFYSENSSSGSTYYAPTPAPSTGYDSGSSSSSSGRSEVQSWTEKHRATCSGCHGSGTCDHCHGSGINSRGHSCGHCRGIGRCLSCKGAGYIYVY